MDGIDVIISGHTHTTLEEPIVVNDTLIVAAGEYGRNLGVLKLSWNGSAVSLADYRLLAVDETVESDPAVAALVEHYKTAVEADYLSKYGYGFDQVLLNNPYKFDTVDEVYDKFNAAVAEVQSKPEEVNSFDNLNKALSLIPGLLCRWTVGLLNLMDYFGILPKKLLWLSPFHGSMIITSMGSLGIRPIYHHIYNFGNLPVFLAYGGRRSVVCCDKDGKAFVKKYIEIKAVTDERICDGYYYATFFKYYRRLLAHPEVLDNPPEEVVRDID